MEDSFNISPYTQHDFLRINFSQLPGRFVIMSDPLVTALDIRVNDQFLITGNRNV